MPGVRATLLGGAALLLLVVLAPPAAAEANLVVTDLGVTPSEPVSDDAVRFPATVANEGDEPSEAFTVRWTLDSERFDDVLVDALDPGENVTVPSRNWTATDGDHRIRVLADARDNTPESDETDNVLQRSFSVAERQVPAGLVDVLETRLPEPREGAAAVPWDGSIHLVGGANGTDVGGDDPREILVFDPANHTLEAANASLPSPVRDAAVVPAPGGIHVLGGLGPGGLRDDIVTYDPGEGTVERRSAHLPAPVCCGDAVWNGTHVLLVGGVDADGPRDGIVAWRPGSNGTTTLQETLPVPRSAHRVVWDGRDLPRAGCPLGCAYVLGGADAAGEPLRSVLRYNPEEGEVTSASASLPENGSVDGAAAWTGTRAYLMGGREDPDHLRRVVRYDPLLDTRDLRPARLPTGRHAAAGAWAGEAVYLLGGRTSGGTVDEVVRYEPGQPDLVLEALEARPSAPITGDDVRFHADVANRGQVRADNFTVRFRVDGSILGSTSYSGLDVNRSITVRSEVWEAVAGSHQATASVFLRDPGGEVSKDNNKATADFTVNEPPVASFTVTVDGLNVTVNATGSSDPDGTVEAYAWDWGDGASAQGPVATHRYGESGNYTVRLTVTDDLGATSTAERPAVPNRPPAADFEVTVQSQTVEVDASPSSDPDGTPLTSYLWKWGDNSTLGQGLRANHTYQEIGIYTITLSVRDELGADDTVEKEVEIWGPIPGPGAAFAVTASLVAVGLRTRLRG